MDLIDLILSQATGLTPERRALLQDHLVNNALTPEESTELIGYVRGYVPRDGQEHEVVAKILFELGKNS